MKKELKKKYVRAMAGQWLTGAGLIGTGIAATLLVPGGIGLNILTLPLAITAIAIPVPMLETKATYEFWKEIDEDKGLD